MENKEYKYVKFLPWIGEHYENGEGFQGKKILILGDSHYCDKPVNRNPICHANWLKNNEKCSYDCMNCVCYNMTNHLMNKEYLAYRRGEKPYEKYFQSHLCFEKIIFGKTVISNSESLEFWKNVVFYNFAQHSQSGASREFEHPEAIPLYMSALNEVVDSLNPIPTHIILWSKRCYNLLPAGIEKDEELIVGDYRTNIRKYNIKGKIVRVIGINHPRRAGQVEWHTLLNTFFELDD